MLIRTDALSLYMFGCLLLKWCCIPKTKIKPDLKSGSGRVIEGLIFFSGPQLTGTLGWKSQNPCLAVVWTDDPCVNLGLLRDDIACMHDCCCRCCRVLPYPCNWCRPHSLLLTHLHQLPLPGHLMTDPTAGDCDSEVSPDPRSLRSTGDGAAGWFGPWGWRDRRGAWLISVENVYRRCRLVAGAQYYGSWLGTNKV